MNNNMGEMEMLVLAVESGSFAAAAKVLRLTPSAVSRGVASLESRLGVRLLQRTTRSLAMTAEGEVFYARATRLLLEVQELETCFSKHSNEPHGKLRVNANVPYGIHKLLPVLPLFASRYPKIVVDLTLSDAVADLNEERVDIAIRLGPLPTAKLRVRKLGYTNMVLVAAPSYLAQYGMPGSPADLSNHRCIAFNFRRSADSWLFQRNGEFFRQSVSGALLADSGESARRYAVAGGGIACLGKFQVFDDLSANRLIPILETFNADEKLHGHALYSAHLHLPSRVRLFVDFLATNCSLSPSLGTG
jgi:DNA-binding transcriptional LysR family regulator